MSELEELYQQIRSCRDCGLAEGRTRAVPGEGPENPTMLFIGEAPGFHEDQQGRPFVGAAGHFLEELLASIGLKRNQVYIANVIKCRPPDNRDPLPAEVAACRKWLDRQIGLLHPRVIIPLGRHSLARFFPGESISKIHGRPLKQNDVILFPMYHPAAALHQGSLRQTIEADILKLPSVLAESQKVTEAKPRQLSLL